MQEVQANLPIGTVVRDRYVVESLLGKGGFGAVYRVRDQRVKGNLFALKEVLIPNQQDKDRLIFEGEVLKRLEHRALPRVYHVFENDTHDRAYILMDYIEGMNLEALRRQQPEGRFSVPQVFSIMAPIIDAVAYLHRQHPPIIHRDIKPANIIEPAAHNGAILVDFGVAKEYDPVATTAAIRVASPGYGAPEQYSKGTNTRTDIYGLGATIYTLLTGTVPIDALYRMTQLGSRGIDPLEPVTSPVPTVPQQVAEAIACAMAMSSNDRFPTVEQFWQALNGQPMRQQPQAPLILPAVPAPYPRVVPRQEAEKTTSGTVQQPMPAPLFVPQQRVGEPPARVSQPPSPAPRPRKFGVPLVLLALSIVLCIGASLWAYVAVHPGAGSPNPTSAPATYPNVAGTYNGTIHNTTADIRTNMSLSIQQNQGRINGNFTVGDELQGNGPFEGTIDTANHIQFTVHSDEVSAPISFSGSVQSDGSLSGTYCSLNEQNQCDPSTGGAGTWHVAHASPGSSASILANNPQPTHHKRKHFF